MRWLMTMGRRLNGGYAAFMLVAFMMGVAGALQAPTLSLFLSREVGAQPFWVGLFYTVNAIAGILVSLALALALSDLVSHKTRIDSLFLDEGFGTLDSETLDAALDALDALNATGKTIGVISHVEAMKERIPVQIKVKKINGLGYSRLDKVFAVE